MLEFGVSASIFKLVMVASLSEHSINVVLDVLDHKLFGAKFSNAEALDVGEIL